MKKGFWTVIEEAAPSLPSAGRLTWTADVAAIVAFCATAGFEVTEHVVRLALSSAEQWNPGFPWIVKEDGDRYTFEPRR